MPVCPTLLRRIFDSTLDQFFEHETQEVLDGVNERSNCGRMAIYMQQIAEANNLRGYFADTEYNRKQNGEVKTMLDGESKVVPITCDLILHSRGTRSEDNLIAVEVKKQDGVDKIKDKERLRALTKDPNKDEIWPWKGEHPEHVCGYVLGVYVELDRNNRRCILEYYRAGDKSDDGVREF